MHWKSSFLLHFEAALKISEPAEAQTNQYNCKSNAVASSFAFFNSISEGSKAKKQIHFCLHFALKEQLV